jgi:hypothetical protein
MDKVPTSERPAEHPVVRAIAALMDFAGSGLTRDRAGRLIRDYHDYRDLSANDVVEVTMAFPASQPDESDPYERPLSGGGWISGVSTDGAP